MKYLRSNMFKRPQLTLTDFNNYQLNTFGVKVKAYHGIDLTFKNIDYLGCIDCDRMQSYNGKEMLKTEKAICLSPKKGCKILMKNLNLTE
jgi:hypothetical protein